MARVAVAVLSILVAGSLLLAAVRLPEFPNLVLEPLTGANKVELAQFRDRPVLLNFWASWCGPCRIELPELEKLSGQLAETGLALLTINVDTNRQAAESYLRKSGVKVPVYRIASRDLQALGLTGIPTTILLDRQGRVVQTYGGYGPGVTADIRRLIQRMSEQEASGTGE
jgi:thiol-disulfide isomerase/thioredoxin